MNEFGEYKELSREHVISMIENMPPETHFAAMFSKIPLRSPNLDTYENSGQLLYLDCEFRFTPEKP